MTKNSAGNFEADLAKIVDLADPTLAQDAATKNYVDTEVTTERIARIADVDAEETARIAGDALKVAKAGDTMTGPLVLNADPSSALHSATKQYVDAGDADQVNKTGDSMTGALAMGDNKITGLATPTATADATNKSYVDAQIATTLATGVAGGPIGTANIADDAVTADKLASILTVTPGSYTNTNITVDQQGRITAAATGSSGAPTANEILTSLKTVDGTGTGLDADLLDGLEATDFATTVSLGTAAYVSLGTFAAASHTHTATNITDFDTAVSNNSDVAANTAKVGLTDNSVTAARISDTDTTFNVGTNVGIGAVASGNYKLEVAGDIAAYGVGNKFLHSHSTNSLGYLQLFSGGGSTNQKIGRIVVNAGKMQFSWINDHLSAGKVVQVDQATGGFEPNSDNAQPLGAAGNRWSEVYAGTGAINTSDRNEKEEIEELSEAELRVAQACKGLVRKFKFKGGTRKHIGVIAQDVRDAFSAEGLDAHEYGLFCSDTWTDEEGNTVTRLGIRYEELLAFIISAL
jgi:hypothetical protein